MRNPCKRVLILAVIASPAIAPSQTTTVVMEPPFKLNPPVPPGQTQLQMTPQQWSQFEQYLARPVFQRNLSASGNPSTGSGGATSASPQ
jgi:hypothetical protein